MKSRVLIFSPDRNDGELAYVGIWQPHIDTSWQTVAVPAERGATHLISTLDQVLTKANLKLTDITHIGTMSGPASYTQLRNYIAVANTLAWVMQVPIFGFSEKTKMPEDIAALITTAKVNVIIEPIYPHQLD